MFLSEYIIKVFLQLEIPNLERQRRTQFGNIQYSYLFLSWSKLIKSGFNILDGKMILYKNIHLNYI